jgi:hypothetical protein
LGLCAALVLTACPSKTVTKTSTEPTPTSPGPSPATSVSPPSPSAPATVTDGTITVTDANDGQTVTLHAGQKLRVTLLSTYWEIQPPSAPLVLRQDVQPIVSPSPGCVAGAGCGTAAATFTALAPGHATVVATRTSCGEAMRCLGNSGHFQVEVVVA